MSKAINLAKLTLAFVIIAGGLSLVIGSLMGGGFSRSDYAKGTNNDPRSILVRTVLIESDDSNAMPADLPPAGSVIAGPKFESLQAAARAPKANEGLSVRAPAVLVQHEESAIIAIAVAGRTFNAIISPNVIDTKQGPVLRIAIEIDRSDADSAGAERDMAFKTVYTTAPGGSIVLDLAGLGVPGSHAVLAINATLIDPTPRPTN